MWRATALIFLIASCAGAEETPGRATGGQTNGSLGQQSVQGSPSGLPVGAPCTDKDGWVQQFPPCSPPDGAALGTCPPPGGPDYPTRDQLPAGVGYCLSSPVYPAGYFTMNCATDADCPGESRCDAPSRICRMPCVSDDQCMAPSICLAQPPNSPGSVRYCACAECVLQERE